MMLNFKIERESDMKERLPDALIDLFDMNSYAGGSLDPSTRRENTFDFDDNVRIVISRERHDDEQIFRVQARPEGGPVMCTNAEAGPKAIIEHVVKKLYNIGFMDIIWKEVNVTAYVADQSTNLNLIMREGDPNEDDIPLDMNSKQQNEPFMTLGTGVTDE
jgi:hypothetical protein